MWEEIYDYGLHSPNRWIEALRRAISASTAGQSMVGVGASDQNSDDSAAIKHVLPQSSQAQ